MLYFAIQGQEMEDFFLKVVQKSKRCNFNMLLLKPLRFIF